MASENRLSQIEDSKVKTTHKRRSEHCKTESNLNAWCQNMTKAEPDNRSAPAANNADVSATKIEAARSHLRIESASNKPIDQFSRHEIGIEGERLATAYFEMRGYDVLKNNWKTPHGEVDIVAYDPTENCVVLAEVKTRLNTGGSKDTMPELSITPKKQAKYRMMALAYIAAHSDVESLRFDVLAINITGEKQAKLRHLVGSFWCDES